MTTLTNRSKQMVSVEDEGGEKIVAPGSTVDVDGRQNWAEHLFVKAGWLEVSGPTAASSEPDPDVLVEDITGEDGAYTVRAADGVVFSPAKNQVRENGSLTNGGLKAYQEAKAKADATEPKTED